MRAYSFILLFVGATVSAQTYTVIHSIGKILDTKSGKYLTIGVKIDESASLMFETKGARAAVLSASKGRFVIQEQSSATTESDIVYTLSSVLSPARGKLSTRAGGINNKLDFEKHFAEGTIAILGSEYKVEISPIAYPMSESQFFYAQYRYNGEVINKKLSNDGKKLVINANKFFSIDDQPINPAEVNDIKLFYYDTNRQESILVTSMDFAVVSDDELKSIADQMENDREGMLEVINSLYGKCSATTLEEALHY